jgi:rare lipoprotein A
VPRAFWILAIAILVSACATVPKPAPSPKYYSDDGPPDAIPDNLASIPNAVPRDEPFHRYANRP